MGASRRAPTVTGFAMVLAASFLSGCVTAPVKPGGPDFDSSFAMGDYHSAAMAAQEHGGFGPDDGRSGDLLWSLKAGSALYADGQVDRALKVFDQTEDHFKIYDEESVFKQYVLNNVAATLVNDNVLDYRGQLYDATMVNTYKALGFLAVGNWEFARVELNRAMDRQRRAADFFAEEIKSQQEEVEKKKGSNPDANLDQGMKVFDERLSAVYTTMDQWEVYPDFVNPLVSYLQGVFLLTRAVDGSDLQKSADAFKEAYGMNPGNAALASDLKLADAVASGRKSLSAVDPSVWVLVENGLGPVKESTRIDIPAVLIAPNGNIAYLGIAYPNLKFRDAAYESFAVYDGGTLLGHTEVVADVDRLVSTEFKKRFRGIITRAVISAMLKTAMQAELAKKHGAMGKFVGALYQLATTRADTRIWSALPKDFQAVRVPRPASGILTVVAGDGSSVQIEVPHSQFCLIHVRAPQPGVTLRGHAIAMDEIGRATIAGNRGRDSVVANSAYQGVPQ